MKVQLASFPQAPLFLSPVPLVRFLVAHLLAVLLVSEVIVLAAQFRGLQVGLVVSHPDLARCLLGHVRYLILRGLSVRSRFPLAIKAIQTMILLPEVSN